MIDETSQEPLIGIALAAYKPNLAYFQAQLQSIVDQTYTNWFCCIGFDSPLADVSTEPSLHTFFTDSRFDFFQNDQTPGLVGNFENTGQACLLRSPKYIAYADQDDIWYPTKLAVLSERLASLPPLSVVHCDMHVLIKQKDGTFQALEKTAWAIENRGVHHVTPLDFFVRNIAAGAGMLFDADLLRRYPKIPGDVYGQDHWYPMIASFYGGVHAVEQPLYSYRIHGDNVAGLSRYSGFFNHSKSSKALGLNKKCLLAFNSSKARYRHAHDAQLPTTRLHFLVTTSGFDFGLGYFLKAVMSLATDRALARACLVRAIGKVLRLFYPNYVDVVRN